MVYYIYDSVVIFAYDKIPGQRALALQLLAAVLDKALSNSQPQTVTGCKLGDNSVDWQALWAYAIGPEPELILTLR